MIVKQKIEKGWKTIIDSDMSNIKEPEKDLQLYTIEDLYKAAELGGVYYCDPEPTSLTIKVVIDNYFSKNFIEKVLRDRNISHKDFEREYMQSPSVEYPPKDLPIKNKENPGEDTLLKNPFYPF